MSEEAYKKLVDLVKKSNRQVLDEQWVRDELLAIRLLNCAEGMLRLYESGKKYTNNDQSSVAYLIGITDYAPTGPAVRIESARVDPPDIDIDFEHGRRDEVKELLKKRWKNVASITTYAKFSSRNIVRDISRVFAVPMADVNDVCKQFEDVHMFLHSEDTKWFIKKYPDVAKFVEVFDGRWRQAGLHAAGVVISKKKLHDVLPLESRAVGGNEERTVCTAYDMEDCARVGLIKMDLLSLEALSVIKDCLDAIEKRHGIKIDLNTIPLDDDAVFAELRSGHNVGVFQAEAAPLTNLLRRLRVDSFDDIVLANALIRPGALLTVGEECVRRKLGIEPIPVIHPRIDKITKDTYGVFIYQEQIMEALVDVGRFTWAEADYVRKIIGKKRDQAEFEAFQQKWVDNTREELGYRLANKLWKDFEKFSGYAFNKAHATAYGLITYRCMWLKIHYPVEYMYALFKNERETSKMSTFYMEAKRLGVAVEMPDINLSDASFSIVGDAIMYGLSNVKGVGDVAVEEILSKRPYSSFDEFLEKVSKRRCNQKVVAALADAGAFRSLGVSYDETKIYDLLGIINLDADDIEIETTKLADIQEDSVSIVRAVVKATRVFPDGAVRVLLEDDSASINFYSDAGVPDKDDIVIAAIYGRRLIGYTVLDEYLYKKKNNLPMTKFEKFLEGDVFNDTWEKARDLGAGTISSNSGTVLLMPLSVRTLRTKKGDMMARLVVTDGEVVFPVVIFPRQYRAVAMWLQPFFPVCAKLITTKDQTITIEDGGIIPVSRYIELKEFSSV